jgi:hypothetical protein
MDMLVAEIMVGVVAVVWMVGMVGVRVLAGSFAVGRFGGVVAGVDW